MGGLMQARYGGPPIRKPQLFCLQAGRAVAALLIVAHHAALFTPKATALVAGRLGVEFFFVLSGIVILNAHWNDPPSWRTLRSFAWKRFRRLYPIYWIVLVPQMIWIVARPRVEHLYQRDPWTILSNLLLIHIGSTRVTVTVAWTLFHEVLFYAVFGLVLLNRRLGLVTLALWLSASCLFFRAGDTLWAFYLSPLHLVFLLGMLAAWAIRKGDTPFPLLLTVLGAVLFGLAAYRSDPFLHSDGNDLLAGLGAALALPGLVQLERSGKLRVAASLIFLGDASYAIYLCHYPFLYAFAPATLRWSAQHHVEVWIWIGAMSVISVALSCLVHVSIERPLLRWMGGFRHPAIRSSAETGAA